MTGQQPVRRLLLSHALSATATMLPVPLLASLVYEATRSTGALALLGGGRMLPYVLLGGVAGRLADRADRALVLRGSALTRCAAAVALAAVVADHGPVALVAALAMLLTVAATPAYAAAGAALATLAHGRELERATGSLTCLETGAWVAGPALGGLLLTCAPPWTAGAFSALLALGAAGSVTGLHLPAPAEAGPRRSLGPDHPVLWLRVCDPRVLSAVVLANVAVDGAGAVLVILVGGAQYGLLVAALGGGALVCLLLVGRTRVSSLPLYVLVTAAALLLAGLLPWIPVRAALLLAAGAAAVATEVAATNTLQRAVPLRQQGQALGALDQLIVGGALVGTVAGPLTAEVLGAAAAVAVAGLLLLPAGVLLLLARHHKSAPASRPPATAPVVRPTGHHANPSTEALVPALAAPGGHG